MLIREELPDSIFKGFCAIALGLWAGEQKAILSYLLFAMGFGWLSLIVAELLGLITIDRRPMAPRDLKVWLR